LKPLPPFGLRLGLKPPRMNNSNEESFFNPAMQCGRLMPGERCVLRKKDMAAWEGYKSHIYFIYRGANMKTPVKIRKLATNIPTANEKVYLDTYKGLKKEGDVYKALRSFSGFDRYCLPFLEYGEEDGLRYIDFEYVAGDTLYNLLKQNLSESKRRGYLAQVFEALHFLAKHGRIHGDVKSDNFWVDESDRVRVFDFEKVRLNPPILEKEAFGSLVEEIDMVVNLVELDTEFGAPELVEKILGGSRVELLKQIGTSPTRENGLERLMDIYERAIERLGAMKGGSVRTRRATRRKTRRTK
jgi:serine/threonine protein kinase